MQTQVLDVKTVSVPTRKTRTIWFLSWRKNEQTGLLEPRLDPSVGVVSVKWFPYGSSFYRGPHWHVIYEGGFRTNIPRKFYEVLEAK